jgi:hypothetical protein
MVYIFPHFYKNIKTQLPFYCCLATPGSYLIKRSSSRLLLSPYSDRDSFFSRDNNRVLLLLMDNNRVLLLLMDNNRVLLLLRDNNRVLLLLMDNNRVLLLLMDRRILVRTNKILVNLPSQPS